MVTPIPWASLPSEEFLSGGFVRPLDDGGHVYYAPNAAVLLSDTFLDTDCFRLTRSANSARVIGLAFAVKTSG